MPATFTQFLRRLTRGPVSDDAHVHFHRGPSGSPAACHDSRCPMPRLTV
jgi:hypothetical protein